MKNLFILLLTIVLTCCTNENDITKVESAISAEFSIEKFVGAKVAYKLNDEIKLGITDKELISSFNNYSKKMKLGKKALSSKLLKIEDEGYIRFYNEDGSVSTVALINTSKNTSESQKLPGLIYLGNTICTSDACASCCGCIPSGSYCTHCEVDTSDCSRTTSG